MLEFFAAKIIQPNFDRVQTSKPTSAEISQVRYSKDYKVATKLPPKIDFKRFLPSDRPAAEAPAIENNHEESEAINPITTKESKSKLSEWLKKFLPKNSKEVRQDIDDCESNRGKTVVVKASGGEAEIICTNESDAEIKIDKEGQTPTIVREISQRGDAFVALSYVFNSRGQKVIGFTQEKIPAPKKVLFESNGFVLREETTYNEFFKNIQNEIIKNSYDIKYDTMRCNLGDNEASLSIESFDGVTLIQCLNKNGTEDLIDFDNLSFGTQKLLKILQVSSKFGYNTKIVFSPDNKFKIEPIYKN